RIAQAIEMGPWPWRFNPGWWAGYAELQYYPPGFAYAGAALHGLSLGGLGLGATYQSLLWLTFLLPGATCYALLLRLLGSPWLALPGAFLALALSGGSRSGVEEGLRWGLVAARLGWALLPLLALALARWTERTRPPISAAVVLAAIVIAHPAHGPAGVVLLALAACHGPGRLTAPLSRGAGLPPTAARLRAVWWLPPPAPPRPGPPPAPGEAPLSPPPPPGHMAGLPPPRPLGSGGVLLCSRPRRAPPRGGWLLGLARAWVVGVAPAALVAEPLGALWPPADRLVDGFLLALVVDASIAL